MTGPEAAPVLRVEDLHVTYRGRTRRRKPVLAVDGVSFEIRPGEVLALVGESGCGKTSIARAVMRLLEPSGGTIVFNGTDITALKNRALRPLRAGIQMVFQDPYESLDPRQTVFDLVAEPLSIHRRLRGRAERREAVFRALERAGLHPAEEIARRYPHHLSGGQRQRVAIAAAMVLEPSVVVADEPVSMLDVSLRAGILRLMLELREQRDLAYLFITHDLSLAWVVADRIAVVYLGRIVEIGPSAEVIGSPRHPYTKALVSVIPVPEAGAAADQIVLVGETPSARAVPAGCRFHPRCWKYEQLGRPEICVTQDPALTGERHRGACHFLLDQDASANLDVEPQGDPA
ncbi:MAG: peptide/nickel transport system ATP-binding protein [Actinomycetota bacterium]|nr:peptide/nickel transport system ATP-binding protein [Actinomycetota bacterium]